MDTPRLPALSVQNSEGKTISEDKDAQESGEESKQETPPAGTAANPSFTELSSNLGTKPFLEWLVLDDFGIEDDSSTQVKIDRFLRAICHSLSAFCETQGPTAAPQTASNSRPDAAAPLVQPQQGDEPSQPLQMFINQVSGSGKPSISVAGKTAKDVDDLTYDLQRVAASADEIIEQRLRKVSVELFHYYVPSDQNPTTSPIQLYWGLLYEVIVRFLFQAKFSRLMQST